MNGKTLGIKRNVRKLNPSKAAGNSAQKKLMSTGLGKYKFPVYDEVPSDKYFSEIVRAHCVDYKDTTAIEVFYKIRNVVACYKIANRIPVSDKEDKTYFIKQIYPETSPRYLPFIDAMGSALDLDIGETFDVEDLKGITEYVILAYEDYSPIGGFKDRIPFTMDDFIKVEEDDD